MARQKSKSRSSPQSEGITRITVAGFKSINQEQSIEIRPLTILAGANSSGKSSIMQPLLLLKQTLEAPYDPGVLLLNGPNVRFTSVDQLLSRTGEKAEANGFHAGIETNARARSSIRSVTTYFTRSKDRGLDIEQTIYGFTNGGEERFYAGMPMDEIQVRIITTELMEKDEYRTDVVLERDRCFLSPTIVLEEIEHSSVENIFPIYNIYFISQFIRRVVHLPGLRGNPERTYPVTVVGPEFPGTFEKYVASIIGQWQREGNQEKLAQVNRDLAQLGLTSGVIARAIDDTQVELLINRFSLLKGDELSDMVSIADVGLGVSQTLPVIVALHTVRPGQLLYLEQPEIHLHPRAQSAMAEVLADAAMQGARLVVETHSSLLLLGIQTLVAEGKLPPELVKLHWFKLRDDGSTEIISADLDETGAFGDWPEDFAEVTLNAENRYLDAARARLKG
jgi:hypothetical protein